MSFERFVIVSIAAIGVDVWFPSAAAGAIAGSCMLAGNWQQKGTIWLALAILATVIGVVFWFAYSMRESFLKSYRIGTVSSARDLITAEDSRWAVRRTFTPDLRRLHFGQSLDTYQVKVSEADSTHWIAVVGDSAVAGTFTLSAGRWAGPSAERSREDFNRILDARCAKTRR